VLILYKCALILTFDLITVIFIAAGILLMIANFEFLRWLMPFISKKMKLEGLNKFHVDGE
jgi:branched-subunit amino acid ABC-type transport system permease component